MLYPETCVTVLIAENHTTCFMCKNMPMDYMDTHVKNVLTKKKKVEMTKTLQEKLDEAAKALEPILWEVLNEIEEDNE